MNFQVADPPSPRERILSDDTQIAWEGVGALTSSAALWEVAGLILFMNLPFGFWRAGVPRFSRRWFLAVHAPVPLAIGLRFLIGVGWRVRLLPLFVGVYFAGQFLGGRARRLRAFRSKSPGESSSAQGR